MYLPSKPKVTLLHATPLSSCEIGMRTCYDSCHQSKNKEVVKFKEDGTVPTKPIEDVDILWKASHMMMHESIMEHSNITFFIKGLSRAVLQELARHRIASYSVKSSRYTLKKLLLTIIWLMVNKGDVESTIREFCISHNIFACEGSFLDIEIEVLTLKISRMMDEYIVDNLIKIVCPKYDIEDFRTLSPVFVEEFTCARNSGDMFKALLVSEVFAVDLTMTINLRSLKNFLKLRDAAAAWESIIDLAIAMKEVLPKEHRSLVTKK